MKKPLIIFAVIVAVLTILNIVFWALNRSAGAPEQSNPASITGPSGAPRITPPAGPPPQY